MYVAATRAAFWLACTGYWWGSGTSALGPSAFLEEIRAACESGAGTSRAGSRRRSPTRRIPRSPSPPWRPRGHVAGARYEAVRAAGALVDEAIAAGAGAAAGAGLAELSEADQALIAAWSRDTSLLLAEREQRRGDQVTSVLLPQRIPVSSLVTIARDPAELAQQVRRPMPRPPAPHAHRGTAFHRWLEERFGPQRLLDPGDLPGAADDEPGEVADPELTALQQRFEAGEWAGRWPSEVEVPFETLIGGRLVRGRIDAVFADSPDGGFDVVDWKTGRQPRAAAEEPGRRRSAGRLPDRLGGAGVPVAGPCHVYLQDDATVRPADLLDLAGLTALIDDIPLAR